MWRRAGGGSSQAGHGCGVEPLLRGIGLRDLTPGRAGGSQLYPSGSGQQPCPRCWQPRAPLGGQVGKSPGLLPVAGTTPCHSTWAHRAATAAWGHKAPGSDPRHSRRYWCQSWVPHPFHIWLCAILLLPTNAGQPSHRMLQQGGGAHTHPGKKAALQAGKQQGTTASCH